MQPFHSLNFGLLARSAHSVVILALGGSNLVPMAEQLGLVVLLTTWGLSFAAALASLPQNLFQVKVAHELASLFVLSLSLDLNVIVHQILSLLDQLLKVSFSRFLSLAGLVDVRQLTSCKQLRFCGLFR